MHCILAQNQTTPDRTAGNPFFGKGFCEVNQYKAAIDRCGNGYKSCELFIDIFKERCKIEETYVSSLRHWSISSQKHICQSGESGTNRRTWVDSIKTTEILAKKHEKIAHDIQENTVAAMVHYKNEKYGKSFIHVKQIKEFEKQFQKTQKVWLDVLRKINEANHLYREASQKLHDAEVSERITKSDVGNDDDEKEKARKTTETRKKEADRCETKYKKLITDMEPARKEYETSMLSILKRTDEFEQKRLEHFKSTLQGFQRTISLGTDTYHTEMLQSFETALKQHNSEDDIKTWNMNYGTGTTTKWPVFEEFKG